MNNEENNNENNENDNNEIMTWLLMKMKWRNVM